jgi:hypothetical protein
MKRFSHYLNETALLSEGSFAKFKVGEQPKFSDRDKEKIGKRLSDYVKMNPNDIQDIHYSAVGKQVKSFLNTNQTEIKVTDKKVLKRLAKYMSIFTVDVNGDNVKVTQGKGKVLFKYSSGRGFFFQSEKSVSNPTTAQQETGTIKFLEFYQYNSGKHPTRNQINDIVGFIFDENWYKSFINHTNAITSVIKLNKKHKIELDSDDSSIGQVIFKMLKKNHSFKQSNDNWNPADIWIYNSSSKSNILTELDSAESVTEFNIIMKKLFNSGDLMGISLKKSVKRTTAKTIDTSNVKPFALKFAPTVYDVKNTYWDIKTSGYPKGFMIRARAKAAAITKVGDIKIYFEGKIDKSSEFLGAIAAPLVKTPGSDTVNFEVDIDTIKSMASKVSASGPMTFKNMDMLEEMDDIKLIYVYVMMRYASDIYKSGNDNLKKLAMSGYKLNDYSSIHYKVGG